MSYVGMTFGKNKAKEVLDEICGRVELLKDFPLMGKAFVEDKKLNIEYYTLPSKLNQLIYCIDGENINIIAVWQNRRDINRLKKTLLEY